MPTKNKTLAAKNEEDFKREFKLCDFPYKPIIETNPAAMNLLYQEFLKADKKPSRELYEISRGYTKEVIDQGIRLGREAIPRFNSNEDIPVMASLIAPFEIDENGELVELPWYTFENEIRQVWQDFANLIISKKLSLNFYCNDIEKTNTIKNLKDIGKEVCDFKNFINIQTNISSYNEDATIFAKSIYLKISQLINPVKQNILQLIIEDSDNETLMSRKIFDKEYQNIDYNADMERYRTIKRSFDLTLRTLFSEITDFQNKTTPSVTICLNGKEIAITSSIMSLFLSYLMNGKIESYSRSESYIEELCMKYKYSGSSKSVRQTIYKIDNKGESKAIKTKDNLKKTISILKLLKGSDTALSLAENEYYML